MIPTKQKDEEGDDNDQDVVTGEIEEDVEDEQEDTEKEKRKGMSIANTVELNFFGQFFNRNIFPVVMGDKWPSKGYSASSFCDKGNSLLFDSCRNFETVIYCCSRGEAKIRKTC